MKRRDICAALDRDPMTVFGLRFTSYGDRIAAVPTFVRGVIPRGRGWSASEVRRGAGEWKRVEAPEWTVTSRDLVTEQDLIDEVDSLTSDMDERIRSIRRARQLAARLDALGVQAKANNASVTIEDMIALDILLTELGAPG